MARKLNNNSKPTNIEVQRHLQTIFAKYSICTATTTKLEKGNDNRRFIVLIIIANWFPLIT